MASDIEEKKSASGVTTEKKDSSSDGGDRDHGVPTQHHGSKTVVPIEEEAHDQENVHVDLGWRSWLVVFVTCFA